MRRLAYLSDDMGVGIKVRGSVCKFPRVYVMSATWLYLLSSPYFYGIPGILEDADAEVESDIHVVVLGTGDIL